MYSARDVQRTISALLDDAPNEREVKRIYAHAFYELVANVSRYDSPAAIDFVDKYEAAAASQSVISNLRGRRFPSMNRAISGAINNSGQPSKTAQSLVDWLVVNAWDYGMDRSPIVSAIRSAG